MKVLVVEDVQMLCREIVSAFSSHPMSSEVHFAYTGSNAQVILNEAQPDFVLLDVELPDVSGLRIAQQLLSERAGVVVLLMSTFFDQTTIFSAFELKGLSGFLSKFELSTSEIPEVVFSARPWKPYISPDVESALRKHNSNLKNIQRTLSRQDRRLLGLIGAGLSDKIISEKLGIPVATLLWRSKQLRLKLNAHSRTDLTVIAQKTGCFRSTWFDLELVDKYDLY